MASLVAFRCCLQCSDCICFNCGKKIVGWLVGCWY